MKGSGVESFVLVVCKSEGSGSEKGENGEEGREERERETDRKSRR